MASGEQWPGFESAGAPARKGTAPRNSAPELCKGSEHSPCAHSTPVIGVVWPLSGRTACGAKQTSMVGELRLQPAQPAAQNRGSRHAARRHWNRGGLQERERRPNSKIGPRYALRTRGARLHAKHRPPTSQRRRRVTRRRRPVLFLPFFAIFCHETR